MTDFTDIPPPRIPLISRNVTILGKRTSARLELQMWRELQAVATRENCTIHEIASLLYLRRYPDTSFTSTLRTFLMLYNRAAATDEGHNKAGHGDFHRMLARAHITLDALHRTPSASPSLVDIQLHPLQS